jgi:acyl-coenzyme A thioesterase PaaI-like protein
MGRFDPVLWEDHHMPESLRTIFMRTFFHLHPAYHGTGGRLTYIASDWSEIKVKIPLNWRTRNYVGTIFGGSMYASVDPMYMIMLIQRLGADYIVWDKSAVIQFKKPGKTTLFAHFILPDEEIKTIKDQLEKDRSLERVYNIELKDRQGDIYASVEKTIYIRKK